VVVSITIPFDFFRQWHPMTIRTLIVDEPLARRRITSLLKVDSDFEVLAEYADGASAARGLVKHKPDLLFLDVQMPGIDGFGALKAGIAKTDYDTFCDIPLRIMATVVARKLATNRPLVDLKGGSQ